MRLTVSSLRESLKSEHRGLILEFRDPARDYRRIDLAAKKLVLIVHERSLDGSTRRAIEARAQETGDLDLPCIDEAGVRRRRDDLVRLCASRQCSFVLIDRLNGEITLRSDHRTAARLYLTGGAGRLSVSDHPSPSSGDRPEFKLDRVAAFFFMENGYVPSPNTVFRAVYRLPVNLTLTCREEGGAWPDLAVFVGESVDEYLTSRLRDFQTLVRASEMDGMETLKQMLWTHLVNAVAAIPDDVVPTLFLSGGVDSLLVFEALRHVKGHTGFRAINFDSSGIGAGADTMAASGICLKYGVDLSVVRARPDELESIIEEVALDCTEPVGDLGYFAATRLFRSVSDTAEMIVTGDGAEVLTSAISAHNLVADVRASTTYKARRLFGAVGAGRLLTAALAGVPGLGRIDTAAAILGNPQKLVLERRFAGASNYKRPNDRRPQITDLFSMKWLSRRDMSMLPDALTLYAYLVGHHDYYYKKVRDLSIRSGVVAFSPYQPEDAFFSLTPHFAALRLAGKLDTTVKTIGRELLGLDDNERFVARRKAALSVDPQVVRHLAASRMARPEIADVVREVFGTMATGHGRRFEPPQPKKLLYMTVLGQWLSAH